MASDLHEHFQNRIDELLVIGGSVVEDQSLAEHLASCSLCQEHLAAGRRLIETLNNSFSFEADPTLSAKVCKSLEVRIRQLEDSSNTRHGWIWICGIAFALTAIGSFLDLELSALAATFLDFPREQMRSLVVGFWILPTLFLFCLFPLLPLLSPSGRPELERMHR